MKDQLEEEISRLRQRLSERETEVEALRAPTSTSKLVLYSLLLIICSLIYWIKTNDQNLKLLERKTAIELEAKDKAIGELTQRLATIGKDYKSVSLDLNNKKSLIGDLTGDLSSIRQQLKTSVETVGNRDKQIKDLLNEIQLRDAENDRLVTRLNHHLLIREAIDGSYQVLYASNETTGKEIVSLVRHVLTEETIVTCDGDPNAQFDVYRNCFRDLSIILHNRLVELFGSVWEVTAGSVGQCFTINVIDDNQREEYFLTIANIYLQVFRFYAKEKQIINQ